MAQATARRTVPSGTGWILGYATGVLFGVLAWLVTTEVTMGVIIFVATGTPLAFAFEQSLDTRGLRPREQRIVFFLLIVGLVLGVLALVSGSGFP